MGRGTKTNCCQAGAHTDTRTHPHKCGVTPFAGCAVNSALMGNKSFFSLGIRQLSGASQKRLLQAQWGALTQVRMLDFVFLTFLPQWNRRVWCLERHADPVRVPGALRGAPHLPAWLLLLPTHTAVAFTPRLLPRRGSEVKVGMQPAPLGRRRQRSPSQRCAAPGGRLGFLTETSSAAGLQEVVALYHR